MQAEYATGSPELRSSDEPEPLLLVEVVPT
jgi:hypothetical protein